MGPWRNSSSGKILWLCIMPLMIVLGFMVLKKSKWDIGYSNNYSTAQEPVSSENLLDRRWRTVESGGQVAKVPSTPPPVVLEEDMDMQQPKCPEVLGSFGAW
ncbi:hypothetical protein Tco_0605987 [Tanacetum coccineum]